MCPRERGHRLHEKVHVRHSLRIETHSRPLDEIICRQTSRLHSQLNSQQKGDGRYPDATVQNRKRANRRQSFRQDLSREGESLGIIIESTQLILFQSTESPMIESVVIFLHDIIQ